ncbi:MAG: hypothetical protein DCE90_13875 [Pseudanabaena sp.]|nr:MAG: hypothetical protein DCE90_13875 [Pseudanabaena sp.]
MKAIVYLMHNNGEQLNLWKQYLPSPEVELISIPAEQDLVTVLEKTASANLPSLLLVEMSIQSTTNKLLQASNVCRWCKENQPSIKIIFLTTRQETELNKVEQKWALRQGALCLLPKLNHQNLQSQIDQIYGFLSLNPPKVKIIADVPEITTENIVQSALGGARLLIKKKDFVAAMNQLKEVIRLNRENIEAYLLCGEIYTELKNFEKAVQAYSQAIAIDSQNLLSYYKRGLAYTSLKNYHAAITDFNHLLELQSDQAKPFNARGIARMAIGDIEGARLDYNQAIALDTNYAEAYLNRGMLHYSIGEQTKAREDYDRAVKIDPQYEGSYFAWANNSEIKGLSVF